MAEKAKTDRRVAKTKKSIRSAFVALLVEKDINDITIKDLADKAKINRKTFYNYYSGIHSVVDELENEINSVFNKAIEETDVVTFLQNPKLIFDKLNELINGEPDFYCNIMRLDRNLSLSAKLLQTLKRHMESNYMERFPGADAARLALVLDYTCAGVFEIYKNWFNSSGRQSLEEVSETLRLISFSGINSVLRIECCRP